MPYATALCLLEGGRLEMVEQKAILFHDRIAYIDDYEGLALDTREGDRLASAMGEKEIALLGGHGAIVTAPTIASAFDQLYFLERACQVQIIARSTGLPFRRLSDRVVRETARKMELVLDSGRLHFDALKRVLDREEPDYVT
jgi:ribulose-5-phosphate 4-epimerase/fuculose-1-phosphate aldolase